MTSDLIRYRVYIQHNATGAVDRAEGEFTEAESAQLRAFIREVRLLQRTKFVSGGMRNEWKIQADGIGGFVPPDLPPEAELAEFLHRLRPIILDDESTSFVRTASLLGSRLRHPYFRRRLKRLREHYRTDHAQRVFRIYPNDTLINCEEALKLWLNSFEYHRDEDKAERISELSSGLPFELQKAIYIDLLGMKANAAVALADWIEEIGRTAAQE